MTPSPEMSFGRVQGLESNKTKSLSPTTLELFGAGDDNGQEVQGTPHRTLSVWIGFKRLRLQTLGRRTEVPNIDRTIAEPFPLTRGSRRSTQVTDHVRSTTAVGGSQRRESREGLPSSLAGAWAELACRGPKG